MTTGGTTPDNAPPEDQRTRPSIAMLLQQLVDDTTAFVRAEVALYRAQAGQKALSAGIAVGLIGGAIVLAQGAVFALLVGAIIALAPSLGTGWAITLVVISAMLVAAILAKVGVSRFVALIEPTGGDK